MAKKLNPELTLNGKPIKITNSWEAMNFGQYLRILKLKDDKIELISILTGLEYDYLKTAKITGVDKLLFVAQFVNTPPSFPEKPTHIGKYKLPLNSKGVFDIQFESLAQFEDMRKCMPFYLETDTDLEKIYKHTEAYATYCALYIQKLRDGDYDGDKAIQMLPEVMLMPASHIITAGSFFFIKLLSLLTGMPKNSPNTAQAPKKRTGKRTKKRSDRSRR